jgi:hypothetical protein
MKTTSNIILVATVACITVLSVQAQLTYSFVTSLGSGSFTLNTNNLVFTGDNGSAAGYTDTLDSLTFKGITYTNLAFSVYNNSFITGYRDGFQILVDKSPYSSSSRLEIDVAGDPSVVSGLSPADLVTVLSSFAALQAGSFSSSSVLYNNPNPPYQQQMGSVTSFQLLPTMSSMGVQTNQFCFRITGNSGATAVVEVCTNIANAMWSPLQTNTLTSGSWTFSDPSWTNNPRRFYRVRIQ